MEEELDPFDFAYAEKLGRTVAEMRATIGNAEYYQQRAFWVWRAAQRELAAQNVDPRRQGGS